MAHPAFLWRGGAFRMRVPHPYRRTEAIAWVRRHFRTGNPGSGASAKGRPITAHPFQPWVAIPGNPESAIADAGTTCLLEDSGGCRGPRIFCRPQILTVGPALNYHLHHANMFLLPRTLLCFDGSADAAGGAV